MLKVHHVDVVGSEDRVKRDGRTDATDCTTFPANAFGNYFAPDREEKCCDERISVCARVCVCLSVRDHIFGTTRPIFNKFFVHVTYGRGSVLLWRCSDMLCPSGFMDDVTLISQGCSTSTPS